MAATAVLAQLIPWLIAILAIGALLCERPSLSATFLFIESLLVTISLSAVEGYAQELMATTVLLSFFSMIVIGNNLYLEISHKTPSTKLSTFNVLLVALLLLIFFAFRDQLSFAKLGDDTPNPPVVIRDGLAMLVSGFSLFVILVSALTILDIKILNRENHHDL